MKVTKPSKQAKHITLDALYPDLNEHELREADETLEHYAAIILRIYERICSDSDAYKSFRALTSPDQSPKLREERSNDVHL